MKKLFIALIVSAFAFPLLAQEPEPYVFKEHKRLACTPVKSQDKTGTCWCFSTASFLESELLRLGKGEQNLSEMFVVRHVYRQKCENFVRRQGHAQLGEGGLAHDLLNAVQAFGIVPEDVYPGRKDPAKPFSHSDLEKTLKTHCEKLAALGERSELPGDYLRGIDSLLDLEFGPLPRKFTVAGQPFTAVQFAEHLGIRAGDYVTLTSFSHHPFWKPFVLEIPDNWANGQFYNLPLEDLMRSMNFALLQGYSVEWDADVSNAGFAAKHGIAIVPGRDWKDKNEAQREGTFKYLEPEQNVSQEYRQQLFDRQVTMDDHLMHITGVVVEENTKGLFYAVKNSWGEVGPIKGFVNCSEAYMRLNTISFTVHKNALPQDVRRLLGLEAGDVNVDANGNPTRRPTREETTMQPAPDPPRTTKIKPKSEILRTAPQKEKQVKD